VVAVEELGYRAAWEAFRAAGARLVPVPLDDDGLRVDALEALTRREHVRALFITPQHQYPTTVTLPTGRRLAILRLAAAERFAIVEDDFDSEFHFEGRPVLPLAANDPAGAVVYVGTLSKVLAPGRRLGYVHAPAEVSACIAEHRRCVDRQGDGALAGGSRTARGRRSTARLADAPHLRRAPRRPLGGVAAPSSRRSGSHSRRWHGALVPRREGSTSSDGQPRRRRRA
jgi:hypothetical protein